MLRPSSIPEPGNALKAMFTSCMQDPGERQKAQLLPFSLLSKKVGGVIITVRKLLGPIVPLFPGIRVYLSGPLTLQKEERPRDKLVKTITVTSGKGYGKMA